jgi:hypothetical protein
MVESLVSKATRYPQQCEEAFLLAHTLLKRLAETSIDFLDLEAFVKSWGALLIQHKCIEVTNSAFNDIQLMDDRLKHRSLDSPKASTPSFRV